MKDKLSYEEFVEGMKSIKLLALDVDGVLTDDSIFFGPDGAEFKKFNISDGFFIVLAMRAGLELAVVSGRVSEATTSRMTDLKVKHILQGQKDKVEMIQPLLKKLGISFDQTAFVGNEILDIKLAGEVGLSIAVADSAPELVDRVDYITENDGGHGAVREVIQAWFESRDINAESLII